MTGDLHDRRVADRDPAHVLDRHRLLVIGQRIRRDAIEPPQRPVQPDHHRRQRLLAQRHHDPIPRPRQPRAEQHRPRPGDHRPLAIVPLQPQPRLRDPRSRAPPVLLPPATLGLRHRPPRRALRTLIAHRDQLRMRLISTDPTARAIDQLLDLHRERVHQRPPPLALRQPATRRLPSGDQPRDRLVITPRQHRRPSQRPGQVIRLKDLHRFLRFLHPAGLQVAR